MYHSGKGMLKMGEVIKIKIFTKGSINHNSRKLSQTRVFPISSVSLLNLFILISSLLLLPHCAKITQERIENKKKEKEKVGGSWGDRERALREKGRKEEREIRRERREGRK